MHHVARMRISGRYAAMAMICTCAAARVVMGVHTLPVDPDTDWWVPNDVVYGLAEADGTLYIGGSFTVIGPRARGLALVNRATGAVESLPGVDGAVSAVAADGAGGWYVGGSFTRVGTFDRANLAHILSDGSVDPDWQPEPDSQIRALAYHAASQTLYVAGTFTSIGGQSRMRLAALQPDGTVTAWQPGPNSHVYSLTLSPDGNTLYVGGYFTTIAGQSRTSVAAFDTSTGNITAWNPTVDDQVRTVALSEDGNTVYIGGRFQMVNSQVRQRLAGLNASDAAITALNANTGGNSPQVLAITQSAGKLYVGGTFLHIGGQPRDRLAALDPATGAALDWNPDLDGDVNALAIADGKLYVGGDFRTVGDQTRWRFAIFDTATDQLTEMDLTADWPVSTLGIQGGKICAGGQFLTFGGARRSYLASIDISTGRPTDWQPEPDDWVSEVALSTDGSTLYVAGMFNTLAGQTRYTMAAVDTNTHQLTAWAPVVATLFGFGTPIHHMLVHEDDVYLAGEFVEINSTSQSYLAAVGASTGELRAWAPSPDGYVRRLGIWNGRLIAAGDFTNIGGQQRGGVAALDLTTGLATNWNPAADNGVQALAITGDTVYLGGYFHNVGGQARSRLAAVDLTTGLANAWNPGANADVLSLALAGGKVFVGGEFSQVNEQSRVRFAAIDAQTGAVDAWNPSADAGAEAMLFDGERLYAAGAFSFVGSTDRTMLATFALNQAPVAQSAALSVAFNSSTASTLAGNDADSDTLSFVVTAQPGHGTVEINSTTGAYTYTPSADYTGSDSFSYQVCDGWTCSNEADISITVSPAPPADPEPDPDPDPDPDDEPDEEPDPPAEPPPVFTLTSIVQPAGGGTVGVSPENSPYEAGTTVTLTAQAAEDYTFVRWEGGASGLNATVNITLNANTQVTAVFLKSTKSTETVIDPDQETAMSIDTLPGAPAARVVIAGGASGSVVRAIVSDAAEHPIRSFVGFANGLALSQRLTIDSDMPNGTFTARLELFYSDEDIAGLPEAQLRLYHWNTAAEVWQPAGSRDVGIAAPTDVPGDYGVDIDNNRVWAIVDHFSEFAAGLIEAQAPPANDPTDPPGQITEDDTVSPLDDEQVEGSTPEEPSLPVCGACGAGSPLAVMLSAMLLGVIHGRRGLRQRR